MLIGELSNHSRFSRDTIRYYEKLGLISVECHNRRDNNYKEYTQQNLSRLLHVRQLKDLGFTLTEITMLVGLLDNKVNPCKDLPQMLESKVALFSKKISQLSHYKNRLLAVRAACNGACVSSCGMPECINAESV